MASDFSFAPYRSIDDFLLSKARFQMPSFNDMERWNNRVVANLLYYQTNYIVVSIIMFAVFGVMSPRKMIIGIAVLLISIGSYVFIMKYMTKSNQRSPTMKRARLRRQSSYVSRENLQSYKPFLTIGIFIAGGFLVVHNFMSVAILLLGVLLPILLILVHASLRLRNLSNKLNNKLENMKITKRTPMGIILNSFNFQPESDDPLK